MDGPTHFDELFALASGNLSSEEEARLRERCASDPELARRLEEYLEVHAATEALETDAPPCRVTFEEVEDALASRAWRTVLRRSLRVAAAVLVLVGGGLLLSQWFPGPGREAGPLVLASIPLTETELPENVTELPAVLTSWRPSDGDEIRWIESFAEARVVAHTSSRPVLLFVHHPTCPACVSMKKDVFADPDVQRELARFVPAMSDVTKERARAKLDGWPWFGVVDATGEVVLSFPGVHTAAEFAAHLKEAATLVGPPVMSWERMNDLAGRLAAARKLEDEGRLGRAHVAFAELADDASAGVFTERAAHGVTRSTQAARRALVLARDLAGSPPGVPAALAELERAEATFEGSPLADDFARVRERLAEKGAFPAVEASR